MYVIRVQLFSRQHPDTATPLGPETPESRSAATCYWQPFSVFGVRNIAEGVQSTTGLSAHFGKLTFGHSICMKIWLRSFYWQETRIASRVVSILGPGDDYQCGGLEPYEIGVSELSKCWVSVSRSLEPTVSHATWSRRSRIPRHGIRSDSLKQFSRSPPGFVDEAHGI